MDIYECIRVSVIERKQTVWVKANDAEEAEENADHYHNVVHHDETEDTETSYHDGASDWASVGEKVSVSEHTGMRNAHKETDIGTDVHVEPMDPDEGFEFESVGRKFMELCNYTNAEMLLGQLLKEAGWLRVTDDNEAWVLSIPDDFIPNL